MLDGEPLDEPTKASPRPPVLSIAQIAPNPDNPRGEIDQEDEEFYDLVASVREVGIISPLTVCTTEAFIRHNPAHAKALSGYEYVVVAGHRRLAAAYDAYMKEVPAYVNDAAAEDPLVWAVAENLLRVGLTPIQEAQALRVLTDPPPAGRGMAQSKAARGIGKTQGFVSQRIALLNLIPELQEKVASGELGLKAARAFVSLPPDQQMAAYEKQTSGAPSSDHYPVMDAGPSPQPAPQASLAQPADDQALAEPALAAPPATGHYPVIGARAAAPASGAATGTATTEKAAPVLTGDAAVSPVSAVPEQRAAQGARTAADDVRDVDWHDIPEFAVAISQVLSAEEIGALAETLINNLG
ncbi:ParB/RepB/Spo0J family partition protein [Kitasatospora sp. RB6PN24]|uniref:ParB/RepB/Spo0J family partition protein n=1 Tax=Kitasatospora humi TaxID=2893891 RepID=UPI001E5DD191|nr:ParB/RepB/Spo0J family partition protein [Kitasatospora humi]MCC9311949.1 ParB/RepB/Spo0J family partition protein [Kitasatospora humi]